MAKSKKRTAEIQAGAAMAEEQQAQIVALEESGQTLRGNLEQRGQQLADANGRIEELTGRGRDLEADLEAARGREAELQSELGRARQAGEEGQARLADLQRVYEAVVEKQQELLSQAVWTKKGMKEFQRRNRIAWNQKRKRN